MVARGDLGAKSGKGFYEHPTVGEATAQGTLLIAKDSTTHVTTITINRADRLNTLTPEFFEDLDRTLAELDTDETVRCVVITGAGDRAFSAGADVASFSDVSKAFKVWRFSRRSEQIFLRLANFPKPTVAAINGHCFGGGLELTLACDFRIAAKRARIGLTEVNLGLVPGAGGSQRLVRILGQARAKELVMLGSRLTADEAASIGLVTKAVENDAFVAEVRAFSEKLAKQAPIAIRLAKVLLNRSPDTPVDAALEMEAMAFGLVTSSEDVFEGLQAFLEKREPKFKGE
jgi:enoyl-CoA hydratase/3-hydroxyacyl-CoA dehydrogenase